MAGRRRSDEELQEEILFEAIRGVVHRGRAELNCPSTGSVHLDRVVVALSLAKAADQLARTEIIAAREDDGVTWEQIGEALGMTRQAAHERFRTGPGGMHSRLYKDKERSSTARASATDVKRSSPSTAKRRAATTRS